VATNKPSTAPDNEGWAKDGFTTVDPPDPSASQGDSDILRGDGRDQDPIKRMKDRDDFQLGKRTPLISKFPTS
jgi:hypothetical protein